jgi:hypothetical protein
MHDSSTLIRTPSMKYFIDTHDRNKGSFPPGRLTEAEFFAKFDELEQAAPKFGVGAHAAHVNLNEGKAFCFMSGPDQEAVRKAHEAVHLPFDSITEVKKVTGADLRYPVSPRAAKNAA